MDRFWGYLSALGLAALAMGVQVVLLPWLAVGELHLSAEQLGWVQAAGLLPTVALLLIGGSFADRPSAHRWLPLLYWAVAVCHGFLLLLWWNQTLGLFGLLFYALLLGFCQAFIQPLRDRLLPNFHRQKVFQHSVVRISLCVYVAQAAGVVIAGQNEWLGIEVVIGLQIMALTLCGGLFFVLLRPASVTVDELPHRDSAKVSEGLAYVAKHPVLKHLMLLVSFNGFMHMGVFVVALPILSHHVYNQGVVSFSLLQLLFVAGGIGGSIGLMRKGTVAQPGRAVLFCLLYTGCLMLAISARPKESGLMLLVMFWGVVAGVSASLGKSLLQQLVPDLYRGRCLSIYQLALFGSAPLGALACGYAVALWGPLALLEVGGWLSIGLFIVYLLVRDIWEIEPHRQGTDAAQEASVSDQKIGD